MRDVTELQSVMVTGLLQRGFTQALRSQAHEAGEVAADPLVPLIELGRSEQAVDFATAEHWSWRRR